jgi:hypothetical protein
LIHPRGGSLKIFKRNVLSSSLGILAVLNVHLNN